MPSLATDPRRRARRFLLILAALLASAAPGVAAAAPNPATHFFSIGPNLRATGLTAGPDGGLWFIGPTQSPGSPSYPIDVVGRIGLAGSKSLFPLSQRWAAGGGRIVLGPDGNLWFTDPTANAVGRVTVAGQVTEYPLPTPGARPGAIVAGPGGALWFVEEGADKVGRVTTSGEVAEFSLATGSQPTGIAEGPDGALWIVERKSGKIARMAPTGAVTATYALPDPASSPREIVLGPGNELWFSEEAKARVGRISPQGAIEEFRIPGENGTGELALGSDGNLWFTAGYAIGSISASGETGEPECVEAGCARPILDLAKGPDGGIWFATDLYPITGGGGSAVDAYSLGGGIGRFYAPLLQIHLGKRATRVNDGLTTVAVSCHGGTAGEACRGWLRLTAWIGGRKVRLDQHRYRLDPASGRRLPLRLGARGKRALASGKKRLVARVLVTRIGAEAVSKRFVLRAGRKR